MLGRSGGAGGRLSVDLSGAEAGLSPARRPPAGSPPAGGKKTGGGRGGGGGLAAPGTPGGGGASGEKRPSLGSVLRKLVVAGVVFSACLLGVVQLVGSTAARTGAFAAGAPRSVAEVREVRDALQAYVRAGHQGSVVLGIVVSYLFLQAFMIPGGWALNVLAGALYRLPVGTALIACCLTAGGTLCYLLNKYLLRDFALLVIPERVKGFQRMVEWQASRGNLVYFMLFLRLTPLAPNWFVNMASPIVGVPLDVFAVSTAFGCIPITLVTVNAGIILDDLHDISDIYSGRTVLLIAMIGVLMLAPVLLRKRLTGVNDKADLSL